MVMRKNVSKTKTNTFRSTRLTKNETSIGYEIRMKNLEIIMPKNSLRFEVSDLIKEANKTNAQSLQETEKLEVYRFSSDPL